MKLTTVVPAFRQEATIVVDVQNIERVIRSITSDYELIIVVDGFVDDTYQRAASLASDHIQVLGYRENGGKGHAIRHGMRHASGDVVAFVDAGMDLDPDGLRTMVEIQGRTQADIVIGSKRHPRSCVQYPPLRRLYSGVYQTLVLLLFGLNVRDTQVGMKVFRREVIEVVEPLLLVKRFAFDIEMLVVAAEMGYNRVVEAPVTLTHGRFPSTIRLRSIFEMLWDTAAVFYRLRILRYYQRLAVTQAAHDAATGGNEAASTDMASG
jgi:glycosyltransferase involved in cell wall biosynthesis